MDAPHGMTNQEKRRFNMIVGGKTIQDRNLKIGHHFAMEMMQMQDMKMIKKKLSKTDMDFVRIIHAATILGDGRARHIRAYKRLVSIIQSLAS